MTIKLHKTQSRVYRKLMVERSIRYATVVCSRGWGKTFLGATAATNAAFELAQLPSRVPNKNVYIIAPTFEQAVEIYYPVLFYELGLERYVTKASKDDGKFLFPNNTMLRLLSYESIDRMRGKGSYFTVWDEVASCKKGMTPKDAWEGVIKPAMITRWSKERAAFYNAPSPSRGLFISTPKGFNFLHDLSVMPANDPEYGTFSFDYTQSPLIDITEIEKARDNMDPITFASEYLASFKESGKSVFYCFDRNKHVKRDLPYFQEKEDVHVNIDFNVGLQCSSAWALRGSQAHYLDEFKGHPDTETLALFLKEKYKGHKIYAYPDPSGRNRHSSSPVGRTDFSILRSCGIEVLARAAAPSIADSVNAVNRMLLTASGKISMYFSVNCPLTAKSLERTVWAGSNDSVAVIDKSKGDEHFSDGVRYGTEFNFPVESGTKTTAKGSWF